MTAKNYYKILQVDAEAEPEVIKAAHARLVRKYHPDVNHAPDATAKMQEINEAYDVLSDPAQRATYDKERLSQSKADQSKSSQSANTPPPKTPPQSQYRDTASTQNAQQSQRKADDERQRRFEEAQRYQAEQRQREDDEVARRDERVRRQRKIGIIGIVVVLVVAYILANPQFLKNLIGGGAPQFIPTAVLFNPTSTTVQNLAPPTDTVAPTSVPTVTPTAIPATPQLVEQGADYKIELVPSAQKRVEVLLYAPKGYPYQSQGFSMIPVVHDIAGNWAITNNYRKETLLAFDTQGIYYTDKQYSPSDQSGLESTDYILTSSQPDQAWYLDIMFGNWGNARIGSANSQGRYGLVLPVHEGMTTRVTLTIGKLEVGVTNLDGSQALKGMYVTVHCQGNDVAGNIIVDPNCENAGDFGDFRRTDSTGVAVFYLAAGTYAIEVNDGSYPYNYTWIKNVSISASEDKQTIVKTTQR